MIRRVDFSANKKKVARDISLPSGWDIALLEPEKINGVMFIEGCVTDGSVLEYPMWRYDISVSEIQWKSPHLVPWKVRSAFVNACRELYEESEDKE